jgi:hypothetical protein
MKVVAACSAVCGLAFIAMGLQMGIFRGGHAVPSDEAETVAEEKQEPEKAGPQFPEDLAPAAKARPVPQAAVFKPGPGPHKMAFLRIDGQLHPWHETIREDWQAEFVGSTELAVVIGNPRKVFVSHHTYPGGAPPITRWLFELEISVIEAKTGKILANRLFRNVPRPLMPVEAWETTAIGRAVSAQQVFNWVSKTCRYGFPETHDPNPIITQAD